MILNKKYYDGFNVVDILFKNLEPKKMLKVLEAFSECDGVDAVEVVRCKDCKYYNPQQHYCEGIGNWFGYDGEWSDNGYCYKAERKEQ